MNITIDLTFKPNGADKGKIEKLTTSLSTDTFDHEGGLDERIEKQNQLNGYHDTAIKEEGKLFLKYKIQKIERHLYRRCNRTGKDYKTFTSNTRSLDFTSQRYSIDTDFYSNLDSDYFIRIWMAIEDFFAFLIDILLHPCIHINKLKKVTCSIC